MGSVKRKALLILMLFVGLVLVACLSLHAQNARPPGSIQLTYRFAPGTAVRYQISQRLTGTRKLPGASAPSPIDAELTSTIRVRCVRILADGSLDLEISTESASLKMAGRPAASYQPPKEIRKVRITPIGKVIGPATPSQEPGRQRSPLDFGSIDSIVLMAILPDGPVDIGGAWTAELPLPIDSTSKLKLAFALEKVESTPDGQVARIKQTLSTPINPGASSDSAPRGSQEGQAELLFSVDRGILLSAQGMIKSTVAVPVSVPMVPGGQQPQDNIATVVLDSKFGVQLLPGTDGAGESVGR